MTFLTVNGSISTRKKKFFRGGIYMDSKECYELLGIQVDYNGSDFNEVVEVDDFIKNKILNGRILENRYNSDKIAFIDNNKTLLALYKPYEKEQEKIKPIKVMRRED